MVPDFTPIPGWDGLQAGLAVTESSEPVLLFGGRFRVGLDGAERRVPGWRRGPDAGIAIAGRDLVVLAGGRYRAGRDLDASGAVSGWTDWTPIPDWPARGARHGDVAAADLDGDGRPELIVVAGGRYRVGWGLEAGVVSGGWEPWTAIPDWPPGDGGVGAAVADLDGDGRPELLVVRGGRQTVGWGLDATGRASEGWSPWAEVAWREGEGSVAAAFAPAAGGSRPRLMTLAGGHHAAQKLALDVDEAASRGAWRLLDFDSQILAVHAALLHTGDVLLFAGSGADADDHEAGRFRTRVWHYPTRRFSAPRTPIDLFCAGQAWLAGGRLLAAGGTRKYGPFRGIRDALAFDPGTRRWTRMRRMLKPRWYPTLVTLGNGRILSVSGRGAGPDLERVPEVFEPGQGWRTLPSPGLLPWYAHLFLLADGRIFYSGGQMSGNRGVRPLRWKLSSGARQVVRGLPAAGLRNQAASVLVGPAQDQRVMIVGGGGADIHEHGGDDDDHPHEEARAPHVATDSVAIVDLSAAEPRYRRTGSLHHARMHLNATLLPDRTVLANGGARVEEHRVDAALHAELYDPRTRRWTLGAKSRVPRLYHSIALLTPDGKVVTAGSNPRPKDDELRIEVFLPPYLFRGPRPRLELPRDRAAYGARITATVPDADRLREVNLLRAGSTTHAFNSDQRLLDVPFEVTGADGVRLRLPGRRTLAPPGWYLVFAVDRDGVPSAGRFLRLG